MLARDCARGVELREVDIWGNPPFGIDPPHNHLVFFDRDSLHQCGELEAQSASYDFVILPISSFGNLKPQPSNFPDKKRIVFFLFADCRYRTVSRANDRVVGQRQDFLEIIS